MDGGFIMYKRNGYIMLYIPSHPRAGKDGMVYEHIIKAEEYLGRPLKKEEVVHHEDRCRSNNSKENLYVFKTQEDHSRYHKSNIKEVLLSGAYYSPKIEKECKNCNKVFNPNKNDVSYCSTACSYEASRVTIRPEKEELYKLLHNNSFSNLARQLGVSDNAIRKWCKAYNIPANAGYYKRNTAQ